LSTQTFDLIFIGGIAMALLAFLSLLRTWSEGEGAARALVIGLLAASMLGYAIFFSPLGYTVEEVPDVFYRVIARVLH